MTNLANFPWSQGNDTAIGLTPAYLTTNAQANTGNGNDAVVGVGIPGAYLNEDVVLLGVYLGPSGVYLSEASKLNMGNGNDVIFGTGGNGIESISVFLDGASGGDGIRSRGIIITGNGSDISLGINGNLGPIIRGQGGDGYDATSNIFNDGSNGGDGGNGVRNLSSGKIQTGNGSDVLAGTGGAGGDGGNARSGVSGDRDGGDGGDGGSGIRNDSEGIIETGNSDDLIIGIGGIGGAGGIKGNNYANSEDGKTGTQGFGIYNDGLINLGRGNDVIEATIGGFGGSGEVGMGQGDDVVRGFGSGIFSGNQGFDQLVFAEGSYQVSDAGGGLFNITSNFNSATMVVSGFEAINNQAFSTGTFVV